MPRLEVKHTVDFDRIDALPRRVPTDADAAAWADVLTKTLAVPRSGASLRPWQGYSLAEIADDPDGRTDIGAWLALPVGVGKTLISFCAPVLLQSLRPVLIVPASLRDKTWSDFESYQGKWRQPKHPYRVVSREELALEQNASLLFDYAPDLIMIDEADDLANPDSAASRRIDRYVWHDDVSVRVAAMTGTPGRNSIMNYWHIVLWCLRDLAPLPLKRAEAEMWAMALDNKPRCVRRPHPGPLGPSLGAAREWYRQRVLETPGVMIVDGDSCDAPLKVRTRLVHEDRILDEAYKAFLTEDENPGGIQVSDTLSRWLLDGQMGCGLYTYYDPPPPEPWRLARRTVAKFVRDKIRFSTHANKHLDTERQVLRAHKEHPIVRNWLAVKDTFKPRTKAKWLTTSTIESVLEWLDEIDAPGIVWCGSVDFAEALAKASGLSYYARKGKSADGLGLHKAPEGRSLIASWNANKKGFNLQAWPRQLLVMPPQSAKWLEQIFGRSHRSGQDQTVVIDVLLTSGGTIDLFETALSEAGFNKQTLTLTQKLLRADIERARPRLSKSNRFRWATRTKDE